MADSPKFVVSISNFRRQKPNLIFVDDVKLIELPKLPEEFTPRPFRVERLPTRPLRPARHTTLLAHFDEVVQGADWVITGEGQLDGQTFSGKTINGVIQAAQKHHVPIAAFCGSVDVTITEMQHMGLDYAVSILNQIGNLDEAKAKSFQNLELTSYNFAHLLKTSKA